MKCNEVTTQLIDYIDGNLSDSIRKEIQQHLEHCSNCTEEFIQTGQLLKIIENTEDKKPSAKLKESFYEMLESEKKADAFKIKKENKSLNSIQFFKYAAQVIILLGFGVLIGMQINYKKESSQQVKTMQQQINQLNAIVHLTTPDQASASQRLKAIQTTHSISQPNNQIIEALIKTMNTDESVNVRMAAMYALSRYSDSDGVKKAFVESLDKQTDPLLQITLINILVNLKDERAKKSIENILNNIETLEPVKEKAEEGLKTFM